MELHLDRFAEAVDFTYGIIREECSPMPFAFTLEDEGRVVKVPGETRILADTYEIKFREVMTPLTEKYRKRFPWFTWHLELQNVPRHKFVYIHIGNDDEDTDACILVGRTCDLIPNTGNGFIGASTQAFKRLYLTLKPKLEAGKKCTIRITDLIL